MTEKFGVEIVSTRFIARFLIETRKNAQNFRKCSVDYVPPYNKTTAYRLSKLKGDNLIGGWFMTSAACNLIIIPQKINTTDTEQDSRRGVLIKVPELDLFVKVTSFSDFEALKSSNMYVSRAGTIQKWKIE